jgi:hypothetical protein
VALITKGSYFLKRLDKLSWSQGCGACLKGAFGSSMKWILEENHSSAAKRFFHSEVIL